MPKVYPIITASDNGKIIQFVLEDATNNNILSVVHHINLDANEDAVLGKIIITDRNQVGNNAFIGECAQYGVNPQPTTDILVIFRYDFMVVNRNYPMVKTFPATGSYAIPGKPKVIATSIGDVSRTGGEAL